MVNLSAVPLGYVRNQGFVKEKKYMALDVVLALKVTQVQIDYIDFERF